ncbi:hypothetical protein ACFS07_20495 [Undibacterium arcticum]
MTGASGNMGQAALEFFFLQRRDRFNVTALVLPGAKDKKNHGPVRKKRGEVRVIWGDLTKYEDVLQGVNGADYVLHVGGMVSPLADHHPELTSKVNIGSIRNIVQAIKAQPDPERVKLAYIGTVAQTGNRMAPIHWGRVGDPIKNQHVRQLRGHQGRCREHRRRFRPQALGIAAPDRHRARQPVAHFRSDPVP